MQFVHLFYSAKHQYDDAMKCLAGCEFFICLALVLSHFQSRIWIVGRYADVFKFIADRQCPDIPLRAFSCIHELLRAACPTRLFFDIEDDTRPPHLAGADPLMVRKVLLLLKGYLASDPWWRREGLRQDCIVFSACALSKMSYHVIFPLLVFVSYADLALFIEDFMAYVAKIGQQRSIATYLNTKSVIDVGIYHRTPTTLRMANAYTYNESDMLVRPMLYDAALSTLPNDPSLAWVQTFYPLHREHRREDEGILFNFDGEGNEWRGIDINDCAHPVSINGEEIMCTPICYHDVRKDERDKDVRAASALSAEAGLRLKKHVFEETPIGAIWPMAVIDAQASAKRPANEWVFKATRETTLFCPGKFVSLMLRDESEHQAKEADPKHIAKEKEEARRILHMLRDANFKYDALRGALQHTALVNANSTKKTQYDIHDFTIPRALLVHPRLCHDHTPVSIAARRDGSVRSTCYQGCATPSTIVYKDDRLREMVLTPEERVADEQRRAAYKAEMAAKKAVRDAAKKTIQKKTPEPRKKKSNKK